MSLLSISLRIRWTLLLRCLSLKLSGKTSSSEEILDWKLFLVILLSGISVGTKQALYNGQTFTLGNSPSIVHLKTGPASQRTLSYSLAFSFFAPWGKNICNLLQNDKRYSNLLALLFTDRLLPCLSLCKGLSREDRRTC
jgi:hypothetical protein